MTDPPETPLLDSVQFPADVRALDKELLPQLAENAACAELMANELAWNESRMRHQVEEIEKFFSLHGSAAPMHQDQAFLRYGDTDFSPATTRGMKAAIQ